MFLCACVRLSQAARSCHRSAVSRRHRARKRNLLLENDFSIAVSPPRTNGRSGFGARRLSAFYGLFRSFFLDFFYSNSFYASLCFIDLACFCSKLIFLSPKLFFADDFNFHLRFSAKTPKLLLLGCHFSAKSFCGAALLPPLGRRRKQWLRRDIERK